MQNLQHPNPDIQAQPATPDLFTRTAARKRKRGPIERFRHQVEGGSHREFDLGDNRTRWTLKELMKSRARGISTVEYPGVRLSEYVRQLRHDYGLVIETVDVPHEGQFPGLHGIYILKSHVELLDFAPTKAKEAA